MNVRCKGDEPFNLINVQLLSFIRPLFIFTTRKVSIHVLGRYMTVQPLSIMDMISPFHLLKMSLTIKFCICSSPWSTQCPLPAHPSCHPNHNTSSTDADARDIDDARSQVYPADGNDDTTCDNMHMTMRTKLKNIIQYGVNFDGEGKQREDVFHPHHHTSHVVEI